MAKKLSIVAIAIAAALLSTVARAESDDADTLPEDGVADTVAHVALELTLPAAAATQLATNATLALGWRKAVAAAVGESGDSAFALLASISGVEDSEIAYDWTALYGSNTAADEDQPASEVLPVPTTGRRAAASGSAVVVTWYLYGGSYSYVGAAKDVDGSALASTLAAALARPEAWAGVDTVALGVTPAQLAAAAAAGSVSTTLPRLRFRPFGKLEATAVGSIIGVAVFLIAILFMATPHIASRVAAWRAARSGMPLKSV